MLELGGTTQLIIAAVPSRFGTRDWFFHGQEAELRRALLEVWFRTGHGQVHSPGIGATIIVKRTLA